MSDTGMAGARCGCHGGSFSWPFVAPSPRVCENPSRRRCDFASTVRSRYRDSKPRLGLLTGSDGNTAAACSVQMLACPLHQAVR